MALTATSIVQGAFRGDVLEHGTKIRVFQLNVGATADYNAGYDIDALKKQFGLNVILGVLDANHRNGSTTQRALSPRWDPNTKKLRFFRLLTSQVELVPATDNAVNDKVDIIVIGF